ncbi:MAG: DUF6252 family protein [Bacteroidota bacterium]|nr:DUF6252 family protein [Bacteroidota bacterium]
MTRIIIACFSVLLLASCKKEVSELPSATQTGTNTFGAKVNGQLWAPQGFGPFPADNLLDATFNSATGMLLINARNFSSSPNETSFEILIANVTGPGTYQLNTTTSRAGSKSYALYFKNRLNPVEEWMTTADYTGSVTITKLDVVNLIVSGTFQFEAVSSNTPPTIKSITEGRFDIKIK